MNEPDQDRRYFAVFFSSPCDGQMPEIHEQCFRAFVSEQPIGGARVEAMREFANSEESEAAFEGNGA